MSNVTIVIPHQHDAPTNNGLPPVLIKWMTLLFKPIAAIAIIIRNLDNNSEWGSDRLDDKILNNFIYNKDVLEIKNGYYHYELVCRTSDENKKHNFTKEEATGLEIGVYDVDKNILYYYWQSR